MLRKITLLAMAVGALVALAVPSAASAADEWTYENVTIANGVVKQEEYEGRLFITLPKPPFPAHGTFSCEVTTTIKVTGTANGTGSAQITEFHPTTESCEGEGLFAGTELIADSSNLPWSVSIGASSLTVIGPITITNTYEGGLVEESTQTFNSMAAATTTIEGSNISTITISGTPTNGWVTFGTLHAETGGKLGVDY